MLPKFKVIKVIVEEQYIIDMYDDKISKINGWTIEEIIKDWFENHSMYSHHATRDGHIIGNSRKYIKSEIIDSEDNGFPI
jgi:hypothetical protein